MSNSKQEQPRFGIVYMLRLKTDPTISYVGSSLGKVELKTSQAVLNSRMCHHRSNYRLWLSDIKHGEKLMNAFDKYGIEAFQQIILEIVKTTDIKILRYIEETHRQEFNPSLNMCSAQLNDEQRHQYKINWLIKNYQRRKSNIQQWQKKTIICECGYSYTKSNKARHEKSKQHIKSQQN